LVTGKYDTLATCHRYMHTSRTKSNEHEPQIFNTQHKIIMRQ